MLLLKNATKNYKMLVFFFHYLKPLNKYKYLTPHLFYNDKHEMMKII